MSEWPSNEEIVYLYLSHPPEVKAMFKRMLATFKLIRSREPLDADELRPLLVNMYGHKADWLDVERDTQLLMEVGMIDMTANLDWVSRPDVDYWPFAEPAE
jgi:hypothetical protein